MNHNLTPNICITRILLIHIICVLCHLICVTEGSLRIVGGNEAVEGQFPYFGALRKKGRQWCGSSIISKDCCITAAHCIKNNDNTVVPASDLQVRAGSIYANSGGQLNNVSEVVIHPRNENIKFDVAILKMATPWIFDDYVKAIKPTKQHVIAGRKLEVCGLGATYRGSGGVEKLLYNWVYAVKTYFCEANGYTSDPTAFCVRSPVGNGICYGDSGGPAVYQDRLIGVARNIRSPDCGTKNFDGYSKVAYMHRWIYETCNL